MINFNKERIEKAVGKNELWKVVNDITKPRSETSWKLEEDGREVEKEEAIADIFNNYFIEKIDKLKINIDKNYVKDHLEKLWGSAGGVYSLP